MAERVSRSEGLLFQGTRLVSLLLIVVLIVGIAIAAVQYLNPPDQTVTVTYAEVQRLLKPAQPTGSGASQSGTVEGQVPENVSRVLKGNEEVLERWLNALPTDQRQNFLQTLSSVIAAAEKDKGADVLDVVNKTKEIYLERMASAAFEPYAAAARQAVLIGQIMLMSGLAGMFILILVLLAIERHLRPGSVPLEDRPATYPEAVD